jgi:hypothetical protein
VPTAAPTVAPTATPADPLALAQAMQDEVRQAQDAKQITGKIGKDLRERLDKIIEALEDDDRSEALDQLGSLSRYLNEQSNKIPADLLARWQAEVAVLQALIGS